MVDADSVKIHSNRENITILVVYTDYPSTIHRFQVPDENFTGLSNIVTNKTM